MLKVGIIGGLGRMGQAIAAVLIGNKEAEITAVSEMASHSKIGTEVYGVTLSDNTASVFASSDVVIDFTPPGNTAKHAKMAADTGVAFVVGTTGLTEEDHAALDAAGEKAVIIQAGNYSLGVNLLMGLTRQAAAKLGTDWDIEVVEMHHKHKVDAPSGTALMLGEAAAEGRGKPLSDLRADVRDGMTGEREEGSIGFATLRGGSVIGEHDVIFASGSERITLSHKAENRTLFADGAVRAALWTKGQNYGRYSMMDVLGL
ncbi:4-hydroxy-tetrahydrodipicolinate reductase [Kordiimonas sp. SCSIO 12603]|uniref:4-hydroxy-tetrahydrodipicolinate reductase n=1 Tax=Kordiimonas sp. SCSIO 12603 TaxID=2829596 RepID=UPI0021029DE7|nr:4-hydroxy-tetrahydrodipicolinate reductase [Kordiimonas sp. SCSIO 12603]UTW59085.1 4-hydroxy-tetrahydrodipicolinate reductase [Kordiimonas sp. SCSIO 12603]